ncbi:MAG: hypothetical protein H6739_04610 [Alphaproteobacteria bacterium]|nr:hypothetical protein [Alphaproteobacteria bacterium]
MPSRHARRRFLLQAEPVLVVMDRHHLEHTDVAKALGISRAFWSALFNGRASMSPRLRRALLDLPWFAGVDQAGLWCVEPPLPPPPEPVPAQQLSIPLTPSEVSP